MTLALIPLHPLYAAEIRDLKCPDLDAQTFAEVRDAFETYSVLVFRGQDISDDQQVQFSERFGTLEVTAKANPGVGSLFAQQSNIDMATNEVISPNDRRMLHQKANYLWHTDSSYRRVPALSSLLLGRVVPPEGADTLFVSTRAAYKELPQATQRRLVGLEAEHSLAHSRGLVDPRALTDEMRDELPPARHPLLRINLINGERSVFAGAHASHVVGWPTDAGRKFVADLNELITQPKFVYSHRWQAGDLVMWDNRCVLHRATPYDAQKYRRVLQRTTVAGNEADYLEERRRVELAAV
jgi:alpha-ketoglutarate-dependent 2,4-dichlorophenoxyacetate dioxygenase